MRNFILFILFIALPASAWGQIYDKKITLKDSLLLRKYQNKAKNFMEQQKFEEVITEYKEIASFLKKKSYWRKYFSYKFEIAHVYGIYLNNSENAEATYKHIIREAEAIPYQDNTVLGTAYSGLSSMALDKNDKDNAFYYLYEAKKLLEKVNPTSKKLYTVYGNLMVFYINIIGNTDSIAHYLDKTYEVLKKVHEGDDEFHEDFAMYYTAKGVVSTQYLNMPYESVKYLEKALKIFKKLHFEEPANQDIETRYHGALMGLGQAYDHLGEYAKALAFFYPSLEYIQNHSKTAMNMAQKIGYYLSFSNVYGSIAEQKSVSQINKEVALDSALYFAQASIKLCEQDEAFQEKLAKLGYPTMASLYISKKEYTKAEIYLRKAEEKMFYVHHNNIKHEDFVYIYAKMGELYYEQRNYEKSLHFFQKTIYCKLPDFQDTLYTANPTTEKIKKHDAAFMLSVLKHKFLALYELVREGNIEKYEASLLETGNIVLEVGTFLIQNATLETDKILILQILDQAYTCLITNTQQLKKYEEVFYFVEKHKYFLLYQNKKEYYKESLIYLSTSKIQQKLK